MSKWWGAIALVVAALAAGQWVRAADDAEAEGNPLVGEEVLLDSLRGGAISAPLAAEAMKRVPKDRAPLGRDFVHQPPLIPHQIRGYEVDLKVNKCLSCHSWKMANQAGAIRISPTHFETREGVTLGDVSPRRYFCLQCHVEQADARPLVDNTFRPVQALSGQ